MLPINIMNIRRTLREVDWLFCVKFSDKVKSAESEMEWTSLKRCRRVATACSRLDSFRSACFSRSLTSTSTPHYGQGFFSFTVGRDSKFR